MFPEFLVMLTHLKITYASMKDKTESNILAVAVVRETVFDIILILDAELVPSKETPAPARAYIIGSIEVFDSILQAPLNKTAD